MISIQQAISLQEIETEYSLLGSDKAEIVRIPTSLKYGGGIGVSAALIQFLASWSRQQSTPVLRLYPSPDTENTFQSLAREPHGMAALYFSQKIEDSNQESFSPKHGLTFVVPQIVAMQSGDYQNTMHGRGIFLACFANARNEFIHPFYSKGSSESLRGREDFHTLAEQLIKTYAPSANRTISDRSFNAISNLLYELFRNTDEHARTDEFGDAYARNLRGVMVKFVTYSEKAISSEINPDDIAQNMFMLRTLANQKTHKDEDGKQKSAKDASFIELTVFDTGPGLVRRWLQKNEATKNTKDLHIEDEVKFVRKCFEQHSTTKDGRGSGHGLTLVLRCLGELSAFLRLRTGRVCLVQDFSSLSSAGAEFNPRHWLKERPELPLVSGAAYSVIIPMSRNAK
nr:hypothetical protein [uncultured Undibacterium sp.]